MQGINPNSQPMRDKKKKKNRENTRQRKQSHAQDNIYMVRQFAYVHGVAGIFIIIRKEYKLWLQYFQTLKNTATTPTIKP